MAGPTIRESLFSIVTRYRSFTYAFTVDIQQMYHQIRVSPQDIKFQKNVWWQSLHSVSKFTFLTD